MRGNWFKRAVAGTLLGASLAFGAAFEAGCGHDNSRIEQPAAGLETRNGTTNEEGVAVFEVNGASFSLTVKDGINGEPVKDAFVRLTVLDDLRVYFVFDQSNKYPSPAMFVFSNVEETANSVKRALSDSEPVSNFVDEAQLYLCRGGGNANQQLLPRNLLLKDRAKMEKVLKANGYPNPSSKPVKLSDLDNVLQDVAEIIVFGGFYVTKLCSISDRGGFASYYRSLCYPEDALFEVWRFMGMPDVPLLVDNPSIVVIPVEPRAGANAWVPPTALIKGTTMRDDGAIVDGANVTLKMNSTPFTATFTTSSSDGEFAYKATACPRHNTYSLSAGKLTSMATSLHGETGTFSVQDGDTVTKNVAMREIYPGFEINDFFRGLASRVADVVGNLIPGAGQASDGGTAQADGGRADAGGGRADGGTSTTCSGESVFYRDCDGDGLGDPRTSAVLCNDEHSGYVANSEDCDDGHANVGRRLVSRVTCGEYRTSRRLDACERGAWSFGDCLPLTDGELDGGVGRADGGPARDGGTAQVDGGASVSQCSTSWSWPSNCRVLYVSDVVHPASDGVDFRGRWVAVQEERIVFINLDTLEVGVVPELPGWFQDYPRIWGDSIYFQRHSTWNYATSLLTRYDILTGAFTEFTYRFNHEGFEWDAPWLGEGPVYGSNVVMCDLPLPETSACSVFNTANESLTALKWFNDPIPESGRSMSLASIYGDTVVAFEETSSSDLCGYSVDGSASWRIKANLQSELIGVGAGFVAYSDSTGLHTVGLQGGEPVLVSPAGYQTYIQSVSDSRIAYTAVDASGNRHGFIYDVRTGTTQDVGLKGNYPKISERGVVSTMIEFVNGGSRTQSYILLCEE